MWGQCWPNNTEMPLMRVRSHDRHGETIMTKSTVLTDDELVQDVQMVADEIGSTPRTTEYKEHGNHSVMTVQRRFGEDDSWKSSMLELGFDEQAVEHRLGEKSPKKIPNEDLADDLVRVASVLGEPPRRVDYKEMGAYSAQTVTQRLGENNKWKTTLKAVGFDVNQTDRHNVVCPNCDNGFRATKTSTSPNCPECGSSINPQRGRIRQQANRQALAQLTNGPVNSDEFVAEGIVAGVEVLKAPTRSPGSRWEDTQPQAVYYLLGDERRAVTLFIESNYEYVSHQVETRASHLSTNWSDEWYTLLLEQWEWLDHDELDV